MRVEIHDGLRSTVSIPASRIVVYDEFDNPIAVVVKVEGRQYIASTVTQPAFPKILKALGIDKTVLVNRIDPARLKPLE